MTEPKRKRIRLAGYNYSQPGAYFVTVCTRERKCILSRIAVGADALGSPLVMLTDAGRIAEKHLLTTDRIKGLHVEKYVIMPNHVHMILMIEREDGRRGRRPLQALYFRKRSGYGNGLSIMNWDKTSFSDPIMTM